MGKGDTDPQHLKPSRRRRRPFPRLCKSHLLSMLPDFNVWYSMFIIILLKLHAEISAKNYASMVDQLIRKDHQRETPHRPIHTLLSDDPRSVAARNFLRDVQYSANHNNPIREKPRARKAPSEKMWVDTEEIDTR